MRYTLRSHLKDETCTQVHIATAVPIYEIYVSNNACIDTVEKKNTKEKPHDTIPERRVRGKNFL